MKFNYAVIVSYSFDDEISVVLFENLKDAREYLERDWKEEVRIDIEENGWDCEYEIFGDNEYARISNHFNDRVDVTEWKIGTVKEASK